MALADVRRPGPAGFLIPSWRVGWLKGGFAQEDSVSSMPGELASTRLAAAALPDRPLLPRQSRLTGLYPLDRDAGLAGPFRAEPWP